jgi:uncharacterized protein
LIGVKLMYGKKIIVFINKSHLKIFFGVCILLILIMIVFLFFVDSLYLENTNNYNVYPESGNSQKPKLAIIIDDFGEDQTGVKEMMEIDRHITFAIMPFLTFSKQDAIRAHEKGHEVIVHLPMQSSKVSKPKLLGPSPVKLSLTNEEIRKIVLESIDAVPNAAGVNIHMGTISSENERIMTCVMEAVKENGLYFVDSRTSQKTVCRSVAKKVGVKFTERNIFLEHASKKKQDIKKQLSLAGDIALKKGHAIAIGHVGSEGGKVTAEAIKEMIPQLESRGIELVFVSELLK